MHSFPWVNTDRFPWRDTLRNPWNSWPQLVWLGTYFWSKTSLGEPEISSEALSNSVRIEDHCMQRSVPKRKREWPAVTSPLMAGGHPDPSGSKKSESIWIWPRLSSHLILSFAAWKGSFVSMLWPFFIHLDFQYNPEFLGITGTLRNDGNTRLEWKSNTYMCKGCKSSFPCLPCRPSCIPGESILYSIFPQWRHHQSVFINAHGAMQSRK